MISDTVLYTADSDMHLHAPEDDLLIFGQNKTRTARIAICVLLLVIAGSTLLRVQQTCSAPGFDVKHDEGQLAGDPGLLFYLTSRLVDNNGFPPDNFRADHRVEHPYAVDLPALFTVGQEFYLAWSYRLFGRNLPLHVFCVMAMSLFASLTAIGVFGLTRELTGKPGWAAFATLVYGLTTANYRTIGFILMREDFSLPLFAMHLWLLARAMRLGSRSAYVTAALALLAALSTWHAMTFIATLETTALFAWYLRTGRNILSGSSARPFPAILAAGSLLIPVLRAKWFPVSPPMLILYGLLLAAWIERRRPFKPLWRLLTGLALFVVLICFSRFFIGDYQHVFELMLSKLIYLGHPPRDPNALSFGARLLWQGPFATASPFYLALQLGISGLMLIIALISGAGDLWRGKGNNRIQVFLIMAFMSLTASLLVKRLVVLCGLMAPVFTAVLLSRLKSSKIKRTAVSITLAFQSFLMLAALPTINNASWYPSFERRNLAEFIYWAQSNLDGQSAIAADFINSAAILAHTEHPVIMQPKYETRSSRERIERYFNTFYQGTPDDLHAFLKGLKCRYLLVDGYLMIAFRYQGGIPWQARPAPGTAADAFLSTRPDRYTAIPGFRLIWQNDEHNSTWRLYEIEPRSD